MTRTNNDSRESVYYGKDELKPEVRSQVIDSEDRIEPLQYELQVFMDPELGLRATIFGYVRGSYFTDVDSTLLRAYDGLSEYIACHLNKSILDRTHNSIEQIDLELLVVGSQGKVLVPTEIEEQKYGSPIQHYEVG